MKSWIKGFYHSFPVQLLFLHFRKYQVLLLFWFILFSTVNGNFMKTFGADSLFLAPEYLGNVNSISYAIVGASIGMFIMSWNITSFILFSRHIRFLAAATNPFLKFCINNSIIFFQGHPFPANQGAGKRNGDPFLFRWLYQWLCFYPGRLTDLFLPGRPEHPATDDAGDC
jgi:hypothetical protein